MQIRKDEMEMDRGFPFRIFRYETGIQEEGLEDYHWHEYMEITSILSGRGCYYVNGCPYEVEAGDMIIFNNMDLHGWRAAEKMELLVITFETELISDRMNTLEYDYLLPFLERGSNFQNRIGRAEEYTGQMKEIMLDTFEEYENQKTGYRLMIKANVLRLLTILLRHYQKGEPQTESLSVRKKQMKRLEQAFAYIRENYDKKITLEEAANLAYMSPNYFSAYFRKVTGKSLRDYLTEQRVEKARHLLKNSSLSLQEIEQECGFTNTSNFYRIFKKKTGVSPGEMRKKV